MDTKTATDILSQFLLIALLIERIVAVGTKLLAPPAQLLTEDSLTPPDPPADPWQSWSKLQVTLALVLALAICCQYKLDLFTKLLLPPKETPQIDIAIIGYVLTASVIAGGSAGIQKILAAFSASAKSMKATARLRIAEAKAHLKLLPP